MKKQTYKKARIHGNLTKRTS